MPLRRSPIILLALLITQQVIAQKQDPAILHKIDLLLTRMTPGRKGWSAEPILGQNDDRPG
jgi:hypothetical protein